MAQGGQVPGTLDILSASHTQVSKQEFRLPLGSGQGGCFSLLCGQTPPWEAAQGRTAESPQLLLLLPLGAALHYFASWGQHCVFVPLLATIRAIQAANGETLSVAHLGAHAPAAGRLQLGFCGGRPGLLSSLGNGTEAPLSAAL